MSDSEQTNSELPPAAAVPCDCPSENGLHGVHHDTCAVVLAGGSRIPEPWSEKIRQRSRDSIFQWIFKGNYIYKAMPYQDAYDDAEQATEKFITSVRESMKGVFDDKA